MFNEENTCCACDYCNRIIYTANTEYEAKYLLIHNVNKQGEHRGEDKVDDKHFCDEICVANWMNKLLGYKSEQTADNKFY